MDQIFVDDSDPNVIFSADWFTGLGTYEYNRTAHGTTTAGARVIYTFKGTSVSAYGTIGALPSNDTNLPNGTWSLDGGAPTFFQLQVTNQTQYRQQYFQTPNFPDDGDHTLTVVFNTQSNVIIWFDYLMVSPSTQSQSYNGYKLVKVDDTSSSIQYAGSWNEGGTPFEYNKTVHVATSSTSKAIFSFYGTAITVFGTLPNTTMNKNQPSASFVLDNGTPIAFTTVPSDQVHTIYQVPIFQAFNLSLDNHQLQIQAHDDSANLWLDFFMYEQLNSVTSSTVTSSFPTSSTARNDSHNHNVGSIAGGSIGGVVCALLAVGLLIWVLRRKRRPLPTLDPSDFSPSNHAYTESRNLSQTFSQTAPSVLSTPITGPSITPLPPVSVFQPLRKTTVPLSLPSQTWIGDSATSASRPGTVQSDDDIQPPPYYTADS